MPENGRLPSSSLRPIAGSGQLEPNAAAAWNALACKVYKERGVKIAPNGPDSSYRSYERQVYWRNWWCARGSCDNAAVPGTSNHGLGLAVDTDDSALVNEFGAPFGWQKAWSDAAHEPWHFKYAPGHYKGDDPGTKYERVKPKPPWFRRFGNRIDQFRERRLSKKARRRQAKSKDRRSALHKAIQGLSGAIDRMQQARKRWLAKHR